MEDVALINGEGETPAEMYHREWERERQIESESAGVTPTVMMYHTTQTLSNGTFMAFYWAIDTAVELTGPLTGLSVCEGSAVCTVQTDPDGRVFVFSGGIFEPGMEYMDHPGGPHGGFTAVFQGGSRENSEDEVRSVVYMTCPITNEGFPDSYNECVLGDATGTTYRWYVPPFWHFIRSYVHTFIRSFLCHTSNLSQIITYSTIEACAVVVPPGIIIISVTVILCLLSLVFFLMIICAEPRDGAILETSTWRTRPTDTDSYEGPAVHGGHVTRSYW
ncbi:hypothetical protein KIPB_002446 [Kipferlia bialata]|uniref:Uncharacterized protein n=1 Tax=Kipferlia bialata TaxID=797122 RepID=A0A9K3CQL7_9EUKA|nr:hypothetical protein KIPB_002446 [Kipferlia bialata]|eukprot:g2446.t1